MLHVTSPSRARGRPTVPVVVGEQFLRDHPDAVLVDVRWYLDGRDGRAAFEAGHLPGARWADLDHDLSAYGLPADAGRHPFPSPQHFADAMGRLGIGDDSIVVAYDDSGGGTAGRLVAMLRMLGRDAALLDGGLRTWSGPVETGPPVSPPPETFTPRDWPAERFASADETAIAAADGGVVIDARSAERFSGEVVVADPRPGHIPGARSAPWTNALGPDGRLRPPAELREHFAALGAADAPDVVAYCGSGVSACMNLIAMEHAGLDPARLFVASWSGWSSDPNRPVETGE